MIYLIAIAALVLYARRSVRVVRELRQLQQDVRTIASSLQRFLER